MRLIQQTQSSSASDIELRSISWTAAENEYEGASNILWWMKKEDKSETRSWCAAESWLYVLNSDMFSISWFSAISMYQNNMIWWVSCAVCASCSRCGNETLISSWRHDWGVKSVLYFWIFFFIHSLMVIWWINSFNDFFFFAASLLWTFSHHSSRWQCILKSISVQFSFFSLFSETEPWIMYCSFFSFINFRILRSMCLKKVLSEAFWNLL